MKTLFIALFSILALALPKQSSASINFDFNIELGLRPQYHDELNAAVVFYEYSNYRGRSIILYPGESLDNITAYNHQFRIRSVEVIGPVTTYLYDETGMWGHEIEIAYSIPDLSQVRMQLSNYSSFNWGYRARSTYVAYRPSGFQIRFYNYGIIIPRHYRSTRRAPQFFSPPSHFKPHFPRPPSARNPINTRPPNPPKAQSPSPRPTPPRATPPRVAPKSIPPRATPPSPTRITPRPSPPNTRPPNAKPPSRPSNPPPPNRPSSPPPPRR